MSESIQTNNNAVASLITLGILSILIPFIGLILGVIGIIASRKARGNRLATAGFICSIVGITVQIFVVLGISAFSVATIEVY